MTESKTILLVDDDAVVLRSEEAYKHIPVFFLTGVSDAYHVNLAMRLKPEGYILKSISQDELICKLYDFFK